jgi:hypothetical protein
MRVDCKYRLDERVARAIEITAQGEGLSPARVLEQILFAYAKGRGLIAPSATPLGERRGGPRVRRVKVKQPA